MRLGAYELVILSRIDLMLFSSYIFGSFFALRVSQLWLVCSRECPNFSPIAYYIGSASQRPRSVRLICDFADHATHFWWPSLISPKNRFCSKRDKNGKPAAPLWSNLPVVRWSQSHRQPPIADHEREKHCLKFYGFNLCVLPKFPD